jgi:hypothetical protein
VKPTRPGKVGRPSDRLNGLSMGRNSTVASGSRWGRYRARSGMQRPGLQCEGHPSYLRYDPEILLYRRQVIFELMVIARGRRAAEYQRLSYQIQLAKARNSFAAEIMLTRAGRTSSHLRVFRPQSGLTQSCLSVSRSRASARRSVISPTSGTP